MAKRLEDYTGAELVDMTDDMRGAIVQLELVLRGIALVSEPVKPELLPVPEPTVDTWTIVGHVFTDEGAATRVLQALQAESQHMVSVDWSYKLGSDIRYVARSRTCSATVEYVKRYTEAVIDEYSGILEANKTVTADYEGQMKEYNAFVKERSKIQSEMYDLMHEERKRRHNQAQILGMWSEYLKIADGNVMTAFSFITRTGKVDAQELLALMADSGMDAECAEVQTKMTEAAQLETPN